MKLYYGTDPCLFKTQFQSKYLFDMMNKQYQSYISIPHPIFNSKTYSIYNILGTSLRGSYGWSKGYSMFLKHMFKPTIPKEKDKDNLKENGNQMKEN